MTWYPPSRRRPCPADFRDASPPVWDWIANEFTPPRNDGRKLGTVAASIIKQCRKNRATAARARKARASC